MEYELEEEPRPNEWVGHHFSDRFAPPMRTRAGTEGLRLDLIDRAIRIPEQETLS